MNEETSPKPHMKPEISNLQRRHRSFDSPMDHFQLIRPARTQSAELQGVEPYAGKPARTDLRRLGRG